LSRFRVSLVAAGVIATLVPACSGTTSPSLPEVVSTPEAGPDVYVQPPAPPTDKLDLLFVVDNSASMGDKQELLRQAVPDMLERLLTPNCVDSTGTVLGASQNGQCASGLLEFQPVRDIHVGIVSSSLGGRGGDACDPNMPNQANTSLNAHNDDKGHLVNRAGSDEHVLAHARVHRAAPGLARTELVGHGRPDFGPGVGFRRRRSSVRVRVRLGDPQGL
jgi:hypothetical protein